MQELIVQNLWILILLSLWVLVWKGWALWIAARKNSKIWFVILLIVNTVGILEILYIFIFSKLGQKNNEKKLHS